MYDSLKSTKMRSFPVWILLCLVVFFVSVSGTTYASTNIAMSQFLNDVRGTSFNMLIAKPHVVIAKKKKRTRKSIRQGYQQAGLNMEILLRKLQLNAKLRAPGYFKDLPQYQEQDNRVGDLLIDLIELQTNEWEKRLTEDINVDGQNNKEASEPDDEVIELSDDIGADLDFDTSLIETTDDEFTLDNQVTTPGALANDSLIQIGNIYAPLFRGFEVERLINGERVKQTLHGRVLSLQEIYAPYPDGMTPVALPIHAVFGSAFLPNKVGAIHVMRMYVFVIVNDPEIDKVRVAAKPIPRFRWDRNQYYISAATGSVLRSVFSEALGAKVEDI